MSPLLSVENVSKSYGGVRAVRDVSFTLAPGRVLGLVGESGAGKSTLARLAMGLERSDAGKVVVLG